MSSMRTNEYRAILPKSAALPDEPDRPSRPLPTPDPEASFLSAEALVDTFRATSGADELIEQVPNFAQPHSWFPLAIFTVTLRLGTAKYLDIWDVDLFDKYTDMQHSIAANRIWFSAEGFSSWGSPETKTGRINCYFSVPVTGHYTCTAQLESDGGGAVVECLIDASSYGPLQFNGPISQPHAAELQAGNHAFRIRQRSGAFFFKGLWVHYVSP
jgi:hypothetical protein